MPPAKRNASKSHAPSNGSHKSRARRPRPPRRAAAPAQAALQSVLDNVRLAVVRLDAHGHLDYANPFFLELTGYGREEVLGSNWVEQFIPASQQSKAQQVFRDLVERELNAQDRRPIRTRAGSEKLINWNNTLLRDARGKIEGVLCIGEDITERQRAEDALRRLEDRFSQVFHASPIGITLSSLADGRVLDVNHSFLKMLGYDREQVIGRTTAELGLWRNASDRAKMAQALRERQSLQDIEMQFRSRTGEIRHALLSVELIELGGRACILNFFHDITERQRIEEDLKFQSTLLESQSEASLDGIVSISRDDRFLRYNRRFVEIWGIPEDILASGLAEPARQFILHQIVNPESYTAAVRGIYEHPDQKSHDEIELKDGRVLDRYSAPIKSADGVNYGRVWYFRDITERKRAEEALASERDLFRTLMDSVPDSIYFKDTYSRFTRINQAQAEILGVASPDQAIGRTDFDFFPPPHAHEAFADEQRIIESGEPMVGKLESLQCADGTTRWVTATKVPLRDTRGRIIGTAGISRDVTQLKNLEHRLQHLNDYLETLIQSANDIIYTVDPRGHFTFVNRRATELTGYTVEQWQGKHFLGAVVPEDRAALAQNLRGRPLDRPQSFELRLNTADKRIIELAVNTTPIFEHGELVGTLGIARDVTDERRLHRVIRDERDRLDAILRSMAEGVLVTDAQYRPILLNRAAEELIEMPREELIGRELDALTLPITRADLDKHLEREPHAETLRSRVRAWGSRMLEITITPLRDDEGHLAGTVSLVRDVTELMRVDQMKSEFISLVSHELRTPLTSIKGYTDLILAGDAGAINEEQREYLGVVKSNVDRLVSLINDLLDISKIEAGRIKLIPVALDLTPLVAEMIRSFKPQLEAKSQIVSADLPPDSVRVSADRDRLSQILWNLLSNAIKYSPPGSRIRIRVHEAGADRETASNPTLIEQHARMLAISIEDEGIGIAPEDQGKLFTKFYRVDNSLTREIGGTGLGLAIVKSFVELHGGRVWVESPVNPQSGRGSRFTFTIPLVQESAFVLTR